MICCNCSRDIPADQGVTVCDRCERLYCDRCWPAHVSERETETDDDDCEMEDDE